MQWSPRAFRPGAAISPPSACLVCRHAETAPTLAAGAQLAAGQAHLPVAAACMRRRIVTRPASSTRGRPATLPIDLLSASLFSARNGRPLQADAQARLTRGRSRRAKPKSAGAAVEQRSRRALTASCSLVRSRRAWRRTSCPLDLPRHHRWRSRRVLHRLRRRRDAALRRRSAALKPRSFLRAPQSARSRASITRPAPANQRGSFGRTRPRTLPAPFAEWSHLLQRGVLRPARRGPQRLAAVGRRASPDCLHGSSRIIARWLLERLFRSRRLCASGAGAKRRHGQRRQQASSTRMPRTGSSGWLCCRGLSPVAQL